MRELPLSGGILARLAGHFGLQSGYSGAIIPTQTLLSHPGAAMMIRCPKCGNQIDGPFCKWCGAAAPTGSTDDAPVKRNIFAWFRGLVRTPQGMDHWWADSSLPLVHLHPFHRSLSTHRPPSPKTLAPITQNRPKKLTPRKAPSAPNAVPIDNASPKAPPGITDKVLSIDAPTLIAAYQTDEKAASARYGNKKLEVTGVVSGSYKAGPGFFGLADAALITLGEPHPVTLDETLQIPGISAYSEDSSLFGQPNTIAIADRLRVGETVTVVCTARDPMPVSEKPVGILVSSEYRVILRDCTLQAPPKAAPEPNENPNPGAIPQAGDQNDPVDAYRPCVEATQHLRVPEQIDLDLPSNFGPPEEPPPQFTFLFSESGVDVYAVRTNLFGPAGYDRLAILVFQDEKVRRETLRSYITSGLVKWAYSDTGGQDWKPIVNFKYVTLDFRWSQLTTGWEPWVWTAILYAPLACNSVSEPAGARPSSMIGVHISGSPSDLPHDSLRYRAAQALRKFQMEEGSK